jgi:DNA invertase Pin-like site-specific DNA recombinase
MKNAYSYIRFSTPEQALGDSERRQLNEAEAYCKQHELKLVNAFADRGVSAFHGKHRESGALGRLLKHVKPGDTILIEDTDRWSRENPLDALNHLRAEVNRGVEVVFLRTRTKVTKDNFEDMSVIVPNFFGALLGNLENRKKAERVGEAWANKRAHANDEKLTAMCPSWLRLSEDRKRFDLIPERVAVVKRIFQMAGSGKGGHSIATVLRGEKVKPFTRSPVWHLSYVHRILDNRAVIGEYMPGTKKNGKPKSTGEVVKDYYPAIVPKELFATVQQLRKARPELKGRSGGRCGSRNVFQKLLFDPLGNTVVYLDKSPGHSTRKNEYLVSYGALVGKPGAKYITWRYDEFLALFLLVCQNAALQPAQRDEPDSGKLDLARMELADTEKQIGNLVDSLARGGSLAIEQKMRKLEAEKVRLQDAIRDLESEVLAKPADPSKVNWKDSTALRENLRATVKRITVDAAKKSFCAEFLDGRTYTLAVEKGIATITTPEADTERRIELIR